MRFFYDQFAMRRLNIFEFEDFSWFPNIWRKSMTRLIVVVHRLFKSEPVITEMIGKALEHSESNQVVDLCSGSGGPMEMVYHELLKEKTELKITMTDLYPNKEVAKKFNQQQGGLYYSLSSVNAAEVPSELVGVRTMICSFHHMPPQVAKNILKNAKDSLQPICIFELSDNSIPHFLAWTAFPVNILLCFFITPMVRPITWYQLLFTYVIPVIPLFYAWDGAISNLRTYSVSDLDEMLVDLRDETYDWKIEVVKKGNNKFLTLVGMPLK